MGLAIKTKVVTVTTAGTRVPLLAADGSDGIDQSKIIAAVIQAKSNTIYLGDSTVSSTVGHVLAASARESFRLDATGVGGGAYDLARVYVDADTNGSKVNVTIFTRV